jgi:hypothetical protein
MKEEEELTPERLEGAVRALRRIHLRRRLEQVQHDLKALGNSADLREKTALGEEAMRLKRALMDPGLTEGGSAA